jgi:hypothetical protein
MTITGTDRSDEVGELLKLLLETPTKEVVTFESMATRMGYKDVRQRYRHVLERAIRLAQNEHNAVFENVHNVGYRRMPSANVAPFCKKSTQQVGRLARRRSRTITAIVKGTNEMSNDTKLDCLRTQGKLGVIAYLASKKVQPAIEPGSNRPPPVAETAHMLLEYIGANRRKKAG